MNLDLARLQFAITTIYHFLFVPVSIGMSAYVAICQTLYWRSGREVLFVNNLGARPIKCAGHVNREDLCFMLASCSDYSHPLRLGCRGAGGQPRLPQSRRAHGRIASRSALVAQAGVRYVSASCTARNR